MCCDYNPSTDQHLCLNLLITGRPERYDTTGTVSWCGALFELAVGQVLYFYFLFVEQHFHCGVCRPCWPVSRSPLKHSAVTRDRFLTSGRASIMLWGGRLDWLPTITTCRSFVYLRTSKFICLWNHFMPSSHLHVSQGLVIIDPLSVLFFSFWQVKDHRRVFFLNKHKRFEPFFKFALSK